MHDEHASIFGPSTLVRPLFISLTHTPLIHYNAFVLVLKWIDSFCLFRPWAQRLLQFQNDILYFVRSVGLLLLLLLFRTSRNEKNLVDRSFFHFFVYCIPISMFGSVWNGHWVSIGSEISVNRWVHFVGWSSTVCEQTYTYVCVCVCARAQWMEFKILSGCPFDQIGNPSVHGLAWPLSSLRPMKTDTSFARSFVGIGTHMN